MILKTSVGVTMLVVVMDAPGFVDPSVSDGDGRVRIQRERPDVAARCTAQQCLSPRGVAIGRCPVIRWQHCTPVPVYVSTL